MRAVVAAVAVAAVVGSAAGAPAADAPPVRVSTTPTGGEPNGSSTSASVSATGRFVAYSSLATDIVPSERYGGPMLTDRRSGRTVVISHRWNGLIASGIEPVVAAENPRFVAFTSFDRLVPGDVEPKRLPGAVLDVSFADVYLYDARTRRVIAVSVGRDGRPVNGNSGVPSISADGRWVAFGSDSPKLVRGDTNGKSDIFVWDRLTRRIVRASISTSGTQSEGFANAPAISGDGRFVAFCDGAPNLAPGAAMWDLYVRDLRAGRTTRAGPGACYERPAISRTGRYVAYATYASQFQAGGTPFMQPVLVDRRTGKLRLAAPAPLPDHARTLTISGDGRLVAYDAISPKTPPPPRPDAMWPDIFVFDRITGTTTRASAGPWQVAPDGSSERPALSEDGRSLVFDSGAHLIQGPHVWQQRVVYLLRLP